MHPPTMVLPSDTVFDLAEIQRFRNETAGTRNVIHLNNAGAALMPDVVTKTQLDHIRLESEIGGYEAAALRSELISGFYSQAALLFNCKARNMAFTSSATDSYSRALSSIPFTRGDVILTDKDDFVSNQIQFLSLQKRIGVQIVHINNAPEGGVDLNDLEEKLRKYQPRLLAITHIPTNSGLVQPVADIAAIVRDHRSSAFSRTWYILDACQSAGQMKLDVQKLQCDFMSLTGRKFLRGPRGTGALYISDEALEAGLEPMFVDMRGAEWTQKDQYRQQPDARRFEDWEFAFSTVVGSKTAIEYCRNIGEERIWRQICALSGHTRQALSAISRISVLDRGTEQGSSVTFHVAGGAPGLIVEQLSRRGINVVASYRAFGLIDFDEKGVDWAIRVSPHYYNTLDEIEIFIEAVKEIIKTR